MTSFARRSVSDTPRWILLFATALIVVGLLQQQHLKPVFAATGGYPWYDAKYIDANYDWGYNPCPSSDPNCMKMTDKGYGTADPWRYNLRNCTSYVAWKINQVFGKNISGWGNASNWYTSAKNAHYTFDSTPQVGDIAQWNLPSPWGHVAYVYAVNKGIASLAEYNAGENNVWGVFSSNRTTASNSAGTPDHYIHIGTVPTPHITGAWDGGNKTLPAVFRPSTGTWYYRTSSGTVSQQFGLSGDIPVPGYYSGSAKPDYAVYRPSNVTWYYLTQSGSLYSQSFGSTGDVPVPGDYDGDGKTNFAVFRPSNDTWYWLTSSGTVSQQFGSSGDIPTPAYWDGGSKTEPGVFRPSNGTWYYLTPSGTVSQQFGLSGDIPEPGYYSGSSKPDYAVFRPSDSTWYFLTQSGSVFTQPYGLSGDIPTPGNYSGNTSEDFGVWRPNNVTWYWMPKGGSSNSQPFGSIGDIPAVSTLPLPILQEYGLL